MGLSSGKNSPLAPHHLEDRRGLKRAGFLAYGAGPAGKAGFVLSTDL